MRLFKGFFIKNSGSYRRGIFCFTVKDIFYASELNFLGEKNADFFREYCGNSDTGKYRAF